MGIQKIQHKSRDFNVTLNFPSTENTLSWAFTAENDGKIYAVELVNVASYQIAGAPATLPYAVTAGSSYSVTIVKQTNGQPASISFSTRRAVDKTITLNVLDFGSYDGQYFYGITSSGLVYVSDLTLCTPNKYLGYGLFDVDPLVATITLPAIPGTGAWQDCRFCVKNNTKLIFCVALRTDINKMYGCYINVDTNAVESMTGGLNQITEIPVTFQADPTSLNIVNYDFIRNKLYIRVSASLAHAFELNLDANSAIRLGYNSLEALSCIGSFNPQDLIFVGRNWDSKINSSEKKQILNYKGYSSNRSLEAYNLSLNTSIGYADGDGGKACTNFNMLGNTVNFLSSGYFDASGDGGGQNMRTVFSAANNTCCGVAQSFRQNGFTISDFNSSTVKRGTLQNIVSGQTYAYLVAASDAADIFVTINNNTKSRIFMLKIDQTYMSYAYYDLPGSLIGYDTTKLRI